MYSVSLSKLGTEQIANFLYQIETTGYPLRIRNLKIKAKKSKGERLMNLSMDVSAFRILDNAPIGGTPQ